MSARTTDSARPTRLARVREIPGLTPVPRRAPADGSPRSASTYSQVVDQIGAAICSGALKPGSVMTVDDVEAATGASRSVIRESTRVLAAQGLIRARQRVGLEVLPETEWNVFDPQVIRWRLDGPHREAQVRALLELRLAFEPEAARLAARNATPELAGRIMSAAGAVWSSGLEGEQASFLEEDTIFHRLILEASGNPMFGKLASVTHEALRQRALHQLHEAPIDLRDAQLHVDLAGHILRKNDQGAWECAREILLRNGPTP